ncbi:class I SAM-dependent rRNA methyltransferase [Halobacteriovorax sp. HLS]|uniref:class I SAM-dependent rRNA methyltransferase n=1 Tax=Halobacteriovorax sp. HLS TaxID=2234000 RepID=UPI000FDCD64D|nr:class I SAM-dependent methyltransferase [Halobacteriovorax sp. HLS]
MRNINLSKQATSRLLIGRSDFYLKDIEDNIKSFRPGEWITVNELYYAFINPFVIKGPILRKVVAIKDFSINTPPLEIITTLLRKSYDRRVQFLDYKNYRLCYGDSDQLPGLIIDVFENCVLVQINTAGIDIHRNEIIDYVASLYPQKKVSFLDNKKYRDNEVLPTYENSFTEDILVNENNFKYTISNSTLQKVGYYFDHRENRLKMETFLGRIAPLKNGMDLFCYTGSWGLHLLRAGVDNVTFVDQADMSENIDHVLDVNGFPNRGEFIRRDVFSHLDLCIQNHERFDIIVNDPPAFSKSEKNLKKALGGYEKLHAKAIKLINDKGFYVAASCTHGVSLKDLDSSVIKAATRIGRTVKMLDVGVQGFDHPFSSFESNEFYIKYLLYQVYE